ncbi:hypothetical protein [Cerasicoccus fimbriatus]|uniref:hypothetical protein n=1 Tax=Cerasicoccus fimbriatus TaxID=3014554 RepID=UPI0022B3C254|nr:hypothetical protein [Cerasicoccus sp. TK19100]
MDKKTFSGKLQEMRKSGFVTQLQRALDQTKWRLRGMKVYALVGKAGTGKSFRARLIADSRRIGAIIDDGLLIHRGKIIAGHSAKRESTYMAAVKTAMFHDVKHRDAMKVALRELKADGVLLLGTSEKMVRRNCLTLGLPEPCEILRIEDIATRDEIETAQRERSSGKHVIPIPVIEIQQAYPKLWARSLKVWFERGMCKLTQNKSYDKTVVRPRFNPKGSITISETALTQMILHCMLEEAPELTARKIKIKETPEGFRIQMKVSLPFGQEAIQTCADLRDYIIRQVENFTGIQIEELSIQIDSVTGKPFKSPSRN